MHQTKTQLSKAFDSIDDHDATLSQTTDQKRQLQEANEMQGQTINLQSKNLQALQAVTQELKGKTDRLQLSSETLIGTLSDMYLRTAGYFRDSLIVLPKNTSKIKGLFSAKKNKKQNASSSEAGKPNSQTSKDLRERARKEIREKNGELYNLTVASIEPNSKKTIPELLEEHFKEVATVDTAKSKAAKITEQAQTAIVFDRSIEERLNRIMELEQELATVKTQYDLLRQQSSEKVETKIKQPPEKSQQQPVRLATEKTDQELKHLQTENAELRNKLDTALTDLEQERNNNHSASMAPPAPPPFTEDAGAPPPPPPFTDDASAEPPQPPPFTADASAAPPPPPPPPFTADASGAAPPQPMPLPKLSSNSASMVNQIGSVTLKNNRVEPNAAATQEAKPTSVIGEINAGQFKLKKVEPSTTQRKPPEATNPVQRALLAKFATLRHIREEEERAPDGVEEDSFSDGESHTY